MIRYPSADNIFLIWNDEGGGRVVGIEILKASELSLMLSKAGNGYSHKFGKTLKVGWQGIRSGDISPKTGGE
jgi:hypothetical protein